MKIKFIWFCTHLHESENENEDAKKNAKTHKKTPHIYKNEDAYFQEQRRKKKIKTETQILEERYTFT